MAKEMTLGNGTKITVQAVSPLLILNLSERYPAPTVPVWRNEEKQRDEENPNDPDYIEAVKKHNQLIMDKTVDCFLLNGVTVIEPGPDVQALDNDDWLETVEYLLDLEVPRRGAGRRAAWLRHHLMDNANELGDIVQAISVASGLVTEAQVEQASNSFRDNESGPTDTTVSIGPDSGQSDQTNSTTWRSEPIRVQGDGPLFS